MNLDQQYRSLFRILGFSSSISLGTVAWGYCINYMNDALETMESILGMSEPNLGLKQGVLTTSLIVGAFVGALNTSRRRYLYLMDSIFILGCLLTTIADYYTLLFARFVQGMACGMSSIVVPIYLREISPIEVYSIVGGMNLVLQFVENVVISYGSGIVCCNALGLFFPKNDPNGVISPYFWRIYFMVPAFFSGIRMLLITFVFTFESPIFSQQIGDQPSVDHFIMHFYKEEWWKTVADSLQSTKRKEAQPVKELFKKNMRKRMELGLVLNVAQQTSGANAVVSYSTMIFQQFTSVETARLLTLFIAVQKIFFYSSTVLVWQKYGRRIPIIAGTSVILLTHLSLTGLSYSYDSLGGVWQDIAGYIIIASVFIYFIGFFHSLGAIAVYLPEFLPDSGVVFTTTVNWITNIVITLTFPVIKYRVEKQNRQAFGVAICFGMYGCITLTALIYFIINVRETKGLSPEQVNELFSQNLKRIADTGQLNKSLTSDSCATSFK